MKRYIAQWRKPYKDLRLRRLTAEALEDRRLQRLDRITRRALRGDADAALQLFKAAGEIPRSYKIDDP